MRQFSMKKLSELTGSAITKQSISRYEKGIMHPKQNALAALSRALGISEAYLNGCGVGIDLPALRASTGCILTEEQIAVIDAKLSFWAERYIEKERRADCQSSFVNPLQNLRTRVRDKRGLKRRNSDADKMSGDHGRGRQIRF